MPRILVVDKDGIWRTALRRLIQENIPGAEVLEAASLIQALPGMRSVDLVLMDVDVSRLRWLDTRKTACKAISTARFAAISASDSRANILGSLVAGFHGFISKRQSDEGMVAAIREVLSGRNCVPASLAEPRALDLVRGEAPPLIPTEGDDSKLTPRQRELLVLLVGGMSNKEIARALQLAGATTRIHVAALLRARKLITSKKPLASNWVCQ